MSEQRVGSVRVTATCNMFEAQADIQQLCEGLYIVSRDIEGLSWMWGSLTGVSAARQHLGMAARRSDRASFERSALE